MIIDSHTHVWPDAIAKRALGQPSGDLVRVGDGTTDGAVATMDAAGVDRSVCLGVGNTPDRVEAANRFVASLDPERFIGFGSIHPGLPIEENIEGLRRHGLRGVKIHPLFQGFALDDPALIALLDAMGGEFVAVIHVGEGGEGSGRCTPAMLAALVREVPSLRVIACHFGGYRLLDEVEETTVGLPIHMDTSWPPGIGSVDADRVRDIIRRHGPDRIIFGSDWPMADPAADIEAIRALDLDDDETDAILGGNLARLVGLS